MSLIFPLLERTHTHALTYMCVQRLIIPFLWAGDVVDNRIRTTEPPAKFETLLPNSHKDYCAGTRVVHKRINKSTL